jgi:prepilin-type N-terminal cleavage/methylation domain-containing protein
MHEYPKFDIQRSTSDSAVGSWKGFTLVELLVVITIIVILLALLTPAIDKAVYAAEKVMCLTQQRTIVQSCLFYAQEHKRVMPPWKLPGRGWSSAYDARTLVDDTGNLNPVIRYPLGLGLLLENGYFPVQQAGKYMHCPVLDNTGNDRDAGLYAGVGMNRQSTLAYGAGWWENPEAATSRIVVGYNYRSASWENHPRHGRMKTTDLGSGDLILVDLPDLRHTGRGMLRSTLADLRLYTHPDGWNRVFADASGGFHEDNDYDSAYEMARPTGGWGVMDGYNGANNGTNLNSTEGGGWLDEHMYRNFINKDTSPAPWTTNPRLQFQ